MGTKKKRNLVLRTFAILAIYTGLFYFGGASGHKLLVPVTLFVTFLHEFGHAAATILTGGHVTAIQINPDGSGFTQSAGGSGGIILMGGYIGSAIFGNLLFYVGARVRHLAPLLLRLIGILMVISAFFWFHSMTSTVILLLFAAGIYAITRFTNWEDETLMFFGLASVLYIIQDFNVGPSSDLHKYAAIIGLFPAKVWMYIWLIIVILLTAGTLKLVLTADPK